MKKLIATALLLSALTGPAHAQTGAGICETSTLLAEKAYLEGTPDAKYPDLKHLHYMVDYWGDMMIVKHDKAIAHRGVEYLAARLKPTGMRLPNEMVVYEALRDFAGKECRGKK